jgi:Nucleotide modification associated domain 1
MPYEDAMQRIKEHIEKNPTTDYHDSLLEDFYLPVFKSGCVKVLVFLPGWRKSTGSKWEYLQAKCLGIQTREFKENWEKLLANATSIDDLTVVISPELCTEWEYDNAIQSSRSIFMQKLHDYGGLEATAYLRESSLLDQIYIKLARLATLQDKEIRGEKQLIQDSKQSEFKGVINYCIIALMRRGLGSELLQKSHEEITKLYDGKVEEIKSLMLAKNSDYGEAWRFMQQTSYVDLSRVKIARVKSIMALKEKTKASEGVDANYHDIVNYCVFALIMIMEGKHTT